MNHLQRLSRRFRIFFLISFWIIPLFTIGFWLTRGYPAVPSVDVFMPANYVHLVPMMPSWALLVGCLVTFIPTGIVMLVIYFLYRLFYLYEKNKIFTADNVRIIRRIGYTILVGEIVSLFYHPAITGLVSSTSHFVRPLVEIKFDIGDVSTFLTAGIIILVAWIMRAGQKLQEENDYTV